MEWLKEAWGDIAENFLIRGTPYNKGTLLKMLLNAGINSVGEPNQCHAVAIDGRAPQFDGGICTRVDCVSLGVVVNKNAKRFYDEGEDFWPKRYAIWGRLWHLSLNRLPMSLSIAKPKARSCLRCFQR